MNLYVGKHPVYVTHTKELEVMALFLRGLQSRMEGRGTRSGKEYDLIREIRQKCSDLLLRMYAEENEITMLNDTDDWWIRRIVWYVRNVIPEDQRS